MKLIAITNVMWGNRAKFHYLFIASICLLFTLLGGREIWTQEHRWADIVSGMFFRHDFLHPYLDSHTQYYDKPLLSYWLIAFVAKITGTLETWTLRLPSALAGMIAIFSIYRLGILLRDKQLGLLSGWLLLTTFYFVFWARTSSADMLNVAGSLTAVTWYFSKRFSTRWVNYTVFFILLAITSLCKGLVGAAVACIAVLTHMVLERTLLQHLSVKLLLSLIPACFIYLLPFWASSYFDGKLYGQSGLYLVYRENILRYLHPFDHQGAMYTYFIYLPIYLLPHSAFFLLALSSLRKRWSSLSPNLQWVGWNLLLLFLFFTLSGSRRNYYILPVIPFAILLTADWILTVTTSIRHYVYVGLTILCSYFMLFVVLDLFPAWYNSHYGVERFAILLKSEANRLQPWNSWNIVMLDAESKLNFYLQLKPDMERYNSEIIRKEYGSNELKQIWPVLNKLPHRTIFISRCLYADALKKILIGYRQIELPNINIPFLKTHSVDSPVAFIAIK